MDDDERHAAHIAMMQRRRPEHFSPWENVRPSGHRLADAILELTLPSFRGAVSELLADEEVGFFGRSNGLRDHLWRHVWWRLQQGQLFMRGLELTSGVEWRSEPHMFDDAEPDFERNRITCFGRTFASVRVHETPPSSPEPPPDASSASEKPKTKRKASGLNFAAQDVPLVARMHALVQSGEARNPTDAARILGKEAAGSGSEQSKVTRLISRYTETFRAISSIQS